MVELISILSMGCHNIMVADILSSGKSDRSEDQNNACTTTNWAVRIHPCGTFFRPLPEPEVNQVNIFLINMEITL